MKILLSIFALFITIIVSGQQLSKKYIINWVTQSDSSIVIDDSTMYIIDGLVAIPVATDFLIDSVLNEFPFDELLKIQVNRPTKDTTIINSLKIPRKKNSINIFIYTKGTQTQSEIKSIFNRAKSVFRNKPVDSTTIPVLSINGNLVASQNAKTEIEELNVKSINSIVFYENKVPLAKFGLKDKSMLVEIWTK